jgi:hypothetical protein
MPLPSSFIMLYEKQYEFAIYLFKGTTSIAAESEPLFGKITLITALLSSTP